jgi:hypothetical protein
MYVRGYMKRCGEESKNRVSSIDFSNLRFRIASILKAFIRLGLLFFGFNRIHILQNVKSTPVVTT